jgi:hypothetical protein
MRKTRHMSPPAAVSEAVLVARYLHLVELLPGSVILKAHHAAFTDLSMEQRTELAAALKTVGQESEHPDIADDPATLATLVGDAAPRDAMMRTELAGVVAPLFIHSAPVAAYFTVGVGSVTIDEQPPWVSELAHHESAPVDAGNVNHHAGIDFKIWG